MRNNGFRAIAREAYLVDRNVTVVRLSDCGTRTKNFADDSVTGWRITICGEKLSLPRILI